MKIYGDLDLRTGDLYEDDVKTYGIVTVANDVDRDALADVEDGQLSVTLHDYSMNMYDTTSLLWKKFNIADPVQSVTEYDDSTANITLNTGHVNVPLNNVIYSDRASTDMLMDFYFKGAFDNWDVISRLTGADVDGHSLSLTWNEYYGLCIHVADQDFHDTRIFPTETDWHHFTCRQDYVNGNLDFSLDGFRIYQTPVVPLPSPTQLRLGQSDVQDSYDTTSLWINGYQGKIAQFRLANEINRTYVDNSFSIYPYREIPDELTEIFIQPQKDVITDDSPNFAVPEVVAPAVYATGDSPFTQEITYEITDEEHRTFFHNDEAATDIIFLLPNVVDQRIFAFVHFNNGKNIKIRSRYTESIVGINGDASNINWNYIKNDETTDNSALIIKGNDAGQWEITTVKGIWKEGNQY